MGRREEGRTRTSLTLNPNPCSDSPIDVTVQMILPMYITPQPSPTIVQTTAALPTARKKGKRKKTKQKTKHTQTYHALMRSHTRNEDAPLSRESVLCCAVPPKEKHSRKAGKQWRCAVLKITKLLPYRTSNNFTTSSLAALSMSVSFSDLSFLSRASSASSSSMSECVIPFVCARCSWWMGAPHQRQ